MIFDRKSLDGGGRFLFFIETVYDDQSNERVERSNTRRATNDIFARRLNVDVHSRLSNVNKKETKNDYTLITLHPH